MTEEIIFHHHYPQGEYRDILVGPQGDIVWERPWQHNLIVEGMSRLLAALLKGDRRSASLTHWAVGAGMTEWDRGSQPTDNDLRKRTKLYQETARIPIASGRGIDFLSNGTPTGKMTDKLAITINLTADQLPDDRQQLREFGLFAGGKNTPNDGFLINHRIHSLIEMKRGFTLQRTLRLTF
jgi:hypothetical protein